MTERFEEAIRVRNEADEICDAATVQSAFDRMAESIQAEYEGKNPILLCVMVGGVFATSELTRRLSFPFELDFIHASRYRGETSGGSLVWRVSPEMPLNGRHVLLIDDILDEGHTLIGIHEALIAQEPASIKTAMLCRKLHDRCAPGAHAEFVGLDLPDRYVFGCGMDYRNYFRQLPAVYAVKEEG